MRDRVSRASRQGHAEKTLRKACLSVDGALSRGGKLHVCAEELPAFFVPHESKKELEAISSIKDSSALTMQMGDLLAKNVNDPQLRDWIMPGFSAATYHDKVVAVVLFMGAMQAYFEYAMSLCCGLHP